MRSRIVAVILIALGTLRADDGVTPFMTDVKSELSPLQDIRIEQCFFRNHDHEVWLVSNRDPATRKLLFRHQRWVEVLFSPNERSLVINDYCGSGETRLRLFHQKAFLDYQQADDLTDSAWQFFATKSHRKTPPGFDHSYAEALRWTSEQTFLVCLHGHIDSRNHIADWLCLYDLSAKSFSTDLDAHNNKQVVLEPE